MVKTVMIVDDLAFVRRTLREILTQGGYQVVGEATDGQQAIELYNALKPALVTMDIVMPRMSGIDATRQILKNDAAARIVIITAMGQESLIMEAVNAGARDYLLKPFTALDVLKTAERALRDDQQQYVRHSSREEPKSK